MFPNAKFEIALDFEELDEVITDLSTIIIKNTYDCYCYCYDTCKRNADYFYITTTNGEKMTNKFIIQELLKQGLKLNCDHVFVEGFYKSKYSDCQFEIWIGS